MNSYCQTLGESPPVASLIQAGDRLPFRLENRPRPKGSLADGDGFTRLRPAACWSGPDRAGWQALSTPIPMKTRLLALIR